MTTAPQRRCSSRSGWRGVDLITGNPEKVRGLEAGGVAVRRVVPTVLHETAENVGYLDAKRTRLPVRHAGRAGAEAQPSRCRMGVHVREEAA